MLTGQRGPLVGRVAQEAAFESAHRGDAGDGREEPDGTRPRCLRLHAAGRGHGQDQRNSIGGRVPPPNSHGLLPPGSGSDRLPTYVLRHVGVGLGEVLAVVDDDAVTTVSRLAVPRWGVDLDLAVRTGRDNVRRAGVLQRRRDGPWLVLSGDEFTSTHVWWVRQEVLDAGASPLVALPTPTIVLVAAEPGGPRGDSVLTQMAEQARRWHDEAPDRLSPYVYRAVAGELRLAVGFGADGRLHLSDR